MSVLAGESQRTQMIRWGRSQGRGCCVVVPIGCLMSVMMILLFAGLAMAQLL